MNEIAIFFNEILKNLFNISGYEHRKKRLEWSLQHSQWSRDEWRQVLWSDESRFALDFHDGRVHVHRMPGERYSQCCIAEHDRYGGGSVMIWGAMWHGGRTAAVVIKGSLNSERYLNEILIPVVIPTVQLHNLRFQDDNAKPHRARTVKTAVDNSGIRTLPWPSRSPDLSPIEHAWDELGRKVRDSYDHSPSSLQCLAERLMEQWQGLETEHLNKLCDSMPDRINACIDARGGHTRF